MELSVLGFSVCAGVILWSGKKLSYYGDLIADLTGMGKVWLAMVLMASITSLPELIVGGQLFCIYRFCGSRGRRHSRELCDQSGHPCHDDVGGSYHRPHVQGVGKAVSACMGFTCDLSYLHCESCGTV